MDWSRRLAEIDPGLKVAQVTGDAGQGSYRDIASAHVIVTTPEKWDGITRRWNDHVYLIGSVKLLMIDEVHLLGDESRGCTLEAVLCRMKTVQRATRLRAGLRSAAAGDTFFSVLVSSRSPRICMQGEGRFFF